MPNDAMVELQVDIRPLYSARTEEDADAQGHLIP